MEFNEDNLAARLQDSLIGDLFEACLITIQEIAPHCESPIEVLFGAALLVGMRMSSGFQSVHFNHSDYPIQPSSTIILIPQQPWENYRIDWVIQSTHKNIRVFIECDGHDYHERTAAQAERDRSRDREITSAGIPFLRFTGREIHRNASACALEAMRLFSDLEKPK